MLKRFCNKCGKEITDGDRFRMTVGITKAGNGDESEIYNGDYDFCPDCMAKLAIIGDVYATDMDKEKTKGKDIEELKPEDC